MRIDRIASAVLAACWGLVPAAASAQAEELPWQLGAGLVVGHDDNLFRAPPGQEVADRYTIASLTGNADLRFGRQHLIVDAELRRSQFDAQHELDNTGYGVDLAWEGATVGRVSWRLGYRGDRSLTSYASVIDPARRTADVETSGQWLARLQVGAAAQWVASAELTHRSLDHSAAVYDNDDVTLDGVALAAVWNPMGMLSTTLRPRYTHGRYPNARNASGPAPLAFDRDDLELGMRWTPSGASTLDARLSWTSQRYTSGTERDFEGVTGQVGWQWRATGKLRTNLSLSRDTGSETSFFDLRTPGATLRGSGDNSRLTTAVRIGVDHDLTGKIGLGVRADWTRRQLSVASRLDALGVDLGGESGRETTRGMGLSLRYTPTARTLIGCDASYQRRSASTGLSSAYSVTGLQCSGQLSMR